MNIKLHPLVRKGNRYCGPAVISILAGIDTGQASALIRHVSGKRRVFGTSYFQLSDALRTLGFDLMVRDDHGSIKAHQRPTLKQWSRAINREDRTFILSCGHHWMIVQGAQYACGVAGGAISLKDSPYLRKRVKGVYEVYRYKEVDVATVLPSLSPRALQMKSFRRKALALAAKIGCKVDEQDMKHAGMIWVFPPDEVVETEDVGHAHCDWDETLEAVQDYEKALNLVRATAVVVS